MIRVLAVLAGKDLALLGRDRTALFWVLVFPVAVVLLNAMVLGDRSPEIALSVQVYEAGDPGLARALESLPGLKVTRAADPEAGRAAVLAGRAVAFVVARPGAAAELHADPRRRAEIEILRAVLAGADRPKPSLVPLSGAGAGARGPLGAPLAAGMAWGLIGAAASLAVLLARERGAGVFLRLVAAPLSRLDIALGKAAACWVVCAVQMLGFALAARVAGAGPTDMPALLVGVLACAGCFAGLTVLFGQCGRSEVPVAAAGWGAGIVFALLGGAIVPFAAMPGWMQAIGQASPARWAMAVFDGALSGGKGLADLAEPVAALAAVGALAFALGAVLFASRAR